MFILVLRVVVGNGFGWLDDIYIDGLISIEPFTITIN